MNGKTVFICAALAAFARSSDAGTVTADSVRADEVLTLEIGVRPPEAPETLYYSFTNDTAQAVADDSGNGYEGIASGCVWSSGGPYAGGCLSFDGVDDCINAGAAPDFPSWAAYSVSVWFLHNGGGDFGPGYGHKILDKTSFYHDWKLALYPDGGFGSVYLGLYEGGANAGLSDGTSNYMDNAWHHVAVVRDGANGEFWVDGVLKAACGGMFSVYSYSDVCVGNSFSGDSYQRKCWSGMLDEVRIFDRALSSNEVVRLYAEGSLLVTNVAAEAVSVTTNLTVCGGLTVTGSVSFAGGVR
jgi:hypothetical protein